jgi:hypothetical protein
MFETSKRGFKNSKSLWPRLGYSVGLLGLEVSAFMTRRFVNASIRSVSLGERIGQWLDEIGHGEPYSPLQTVGLVLVLSIVLIAAGAIGWHVVATTLKGE